MSQLCRVNSLICPYTKDPVEEAGGGGSTYTGLKIILDHNNWIAAAQVLIYDDADSEYAVALTELNETYGYTFNDIVAGQSITNSTYGGDGTFVTMMNSGLPDIGNPTSSVGSVQWSSNGSATANLEMYYKPSTAKTLGKIHLCLSSSYDDAAANATITIKDQDDNTLTPTAIDRAYQSTGATYTWVQLTF